MEVIGRLTWVLLKGLVGTVITGWVVAKLWLWFFVPLALPEVNFFHASGLVVFMRLLIFHVPAASAIQADFALKKNNPSDYAFIDGMRTFLIHIGMPLIALGFGAVMRHFMTH